MTAENRPVIEVVDTPAAFERMRAEWDALLERSGLPTPFLTHDWLWSWWTTVGSGRELFLITARSPAGELVALAPLVISRRHGLRVAELLGTGLSDYLYFVFGDAPERVVDELVQMLVRHRRRWDVIALQVLDDGPVGLPEIMAAAGRQGLRAHHRVYEVAPYLTVRGTWEEFVATRPKKFRYMLREREKRFGALPGARVRRLEAIEIDEGLADTLWAIEHRSWKARAGTSPQLDPAVREFYREFLRRFARRGWLQAWLAEIDGRPVAYVLTFLFAGRVMLYATSYDEAYAQPAPGVLLLQRSIQDAFKQKALEYDFLCGNELYKTRWASDERRVLQIVLSRWTPRSLAGEALAYRLRWTFARSNRLRALKTRLVGLGVRLGRQSSDAT